MLQRTVAKNLKPISKSRSKNITRILESKEDRQRYRTRIPPFQIQNASLRNEKFPSRFSKREGSGKTIFTRFRSVPGGECSMRAVIPLGISSAFPQGEYGPPSPPFILQHRRLPSPQLTRHKPRYIGIRSTRKARRSMDPSKMLEVDERREGRLKSPPLAAPEFACEECAGIIAGKPTCESSGPRELIIRGSRLR
ncbi:hypothetical protein KM043_003559 [Ampulex compressa]|nr:hypothetical protein KM043_003559 [Ampulex compressa]